WAAGQVIFGGSGVTGTGLGTCVGVVVPVQPIDTIALAARQAARSSLLRTKCKSLTLILTSPFVSRDRCAVLATLAVAHLALGWHLGFQSVPGYVWSWLFIALTAVPAWRLAR